MTSVGIGMGCPIEWYFRVKPMEQSSLNFQACLVHVLGWITPCPLPQTSRGQGNFILKVQAGQILEIIKLILFLKHT
jgi:hypothetical protein